MKLIITTQYKENYGFHDWDGEGKCPQYWKYKGGTTYVYPSVDVEKADKLVAFLKPYIEYINDAEEQYVIDYSVEPDTYVTEDTKLALEHGQGDTRYLDHELWIADGNVWQERGYVVGSRHETKAGEMHVWHDKLELGGDQHCYGYFIDGLATEMKRSA